MRAGSSVFYVKDEDGTRQQVTTEAETGLLIDFSEIENASREADSSQSNQLVSLLDTSLPSIPAAMADHQSLATPLVPPVSQQQQYGAKYDQVPDEDFFVQTSNVHTSTNNVTSNTTAVPTSQGNPFTNVAKQPSLPWMQGQGKDSKQVQNVRTNPFERTNAVATPRYDPIAADIVPSTNNPTETIPPRYDDVPVEGGPSWTGPASQPNQWVRFYDEVPPENDSNSQRYYDDVPKENSSGSNSVQPKPIQAALQAGKPAAACAPISVPKMTPIQPQHTYSPVPNDQSVADSFDPLKNKNKQPIYGQVKKTSNSSKPEGKTAPMRPPPPQFSTRQSAQQNTTRQITTNNSTRQTNVQTSARQTSGAPTNTFQTGSVAEKTKMLNSKLNFTPMMHHVTPDKYTDAQQYAPTNHDDSTSSDRAPLISLRRSSENDIKIPNKEIDFQHPKEVQATFVGTKKYKDDDHLVLMAYPKKDKKAGNLIDFSPVSENNPGNNYVLDPTTPDLPPRIPLLQQPPTKGRRTIPREERRSDPLAQRSGAHVFHQSKSKEESSHSCPTEFGREDSTAPPIPPRDPITDTRPTFHRQLSHPRTKSDSQKSYILPIMRDGEKISNTHYFLLPPKPKHMSDENEQFVNVPLSSRTAHIKPIMRDGSDTHYLVTPPPPLAGSSDFFADSLKAMNLIGGSSNNTDHHDGGHKSHVNHLHGSPSRDNRSKQGFDLSSLNPILPEDNSHLSKFSNSSGSSTSSTSSKFSNSAYFNQPVHNHHSSSQSQDDSDLLQSETLATASEKVRRVMAQVHGVTKDESRGALIGNAWDVDRAVHELKTEQLFQLGGVSREQCEDLLKAMNWDLELASTVMLEQNAHQGT